ncbi:MAG TPA: hypothetical protein VJG83_06135 [archaeon]|nr:hypothetical protein [archaeon]
MEMKGIIFTIDAGLAIAIVIMTLAAIAALSFSGSGDAATKGLLFYKSADDAVQKYLDNSTRPEPDVSGNNVHCYQLYGYAGDGTVNEKVEICQKAG